MAERAKPTGTKAPRKTGTVARTTPTKPKRAFGRSLGDFPDLTPAETHLLARVAKGEGCILNGGERPEAADPAWTLRAGLIRFLLLGGDDDNPAHERGVRVVGAWIVDPLNLDYVDATGPLVLVKSRIVETITMCDARLASVALGGSLIVGLSADRARITGSVFLDAGFSATGEVRMLSATVDGSLNCCGSTFSNPGGNALSADSARITGSVVLNVGFTATGEVRMLGATIGGSLNCRGSTFSNPDGNALIADRATITGAVFLNTGFAATGAVRLPGATIGGNLQCSGGTFSNPGGNALIADGAKITGNVFMNTGFAATGAVNLPGATIGGQLGCSGGTFSNPGGNALNMQDARIVGILFVNQIKCEQGVVDLQSAHIGVLHDDADAWSSARYRLDHLHYDRLIGPGMTVGERIDWLNHQEPSQLDGPGFKPQPWEQLIRVLRTAGHGRDADEVAIAKQEALRKAGRIGTRVAKKTFRWNWEKAGLLRARQAVDAGWNRLANPASRAFHFIYGMLAGYGYRPTRIIFWMIGMMAVSGCYFSYAAYSGLIAPTRAELIVHQSVHDDLGSEQVDLASCGIQGEVPSTHFWTQCPSMPSEYTTFNPWWYAIDLALPLVDLQQDTEWGPAATWTDQAGVVTTLPGGVIARIIMWLNIVMGWVLSLMFVAIVGRLVEKD